MIEPARELVDDVRTGRVDGVDTREIEDDEARVRRVCRDFVRQALGCPEEDGSFELEQPDVRARSAQDLQFALATLALATITARELARVL